MALNYPGGFITKTPPAPTSTAAPGVWTLDQAMQNVKAGNWPPNGPYFIEDVFSTYLYTGTGASNTINNGIDLSGKGGLVWCKDRGATQYYHNLIDTARGVDKILFTNLTNANFTSANSLTSFNSNGFTLGTDAASGGTNSSGVNYVSWTFREQPKFFDVVTWTASATPALNVIPHSLGVIPGAIFIKNTTIAEDWSVVHRSANGYFVLNSTAGAAGTGTPGIGTSGAWVNCTSTTFDASSLAAQVGRTYVAYLFAHDAGGFGLTGSDNVISCGSFATNGSGGATVTLNYEPQWILFKNTSAAENWVLVDTMRGMSVAGSTRFLRPNTGDAESGLGTGAVQPTATGFVLPNSGIFASSNTYIYIAIRRGPMKTPTDATKVFVPATVTGGTNYDVTFTSAPYVDAIISWKNKTAGINYASPCWNDRLRGFPIDMTGNTYTNNPGIISNTTNAEATGASPGASNYLSGVTMNRAVWGGGWTGYLGVFLGLRRAPGFFDVVCYTGNNTSRTISHNLGAIPELMIVKVRSVADVWFVYSSAISNTEYLELNTTAAKQTNSLLWDSTTPTSSVFSVGASDANNNGQRYVAYLFATLAGVSKVGSYTGTGTTLQVNCGFTGGARLVIIKRTDSTGDWYVWNSASGIVVGNDPYMLLNSDAAEVTNTDYVDTFSSGFEISSTAPAAINANGGTFIFLAIA